MKKVVIVGAGFAGIAAARRLARKRKEVEVRVIDKSGYFNFLPLLPDTLGRGISPGLLEWGLKALEAGKIDFINDEALGINEEKKEVHLSSGTVSYDYLVIACGSETNFYGNQALSKSSLKLDNTSDARSILSRLEADDFDSCVVSGGGYTGVELASNLRAYFQRKKSDKRIIICERAPAILGMLPEWMRSYASDNLKKQKIEVLTGVFVEEAGEGRVRFSSGATLEKSLLIWAAGVKAPELLVQVRAEKNKQGRLMVDEYLRLNESCFALGDASYFQYKGAYLRMAVQFSIAEGESSAGNILRSIRGERLKKYRPRDLGLIIPMANNRSCGEVLGFRVKGLLATALHYLMCIYRLPGIKNKYGLLRYLLKGGGV